MCVPVVSLLGLLQGRRGAVVVLHCTAPLVRGLDGERERRGDITLSYTQMLCQFQAIQFSHEIDTMKYNPRFTCHKNNSMRDKPQVGMVVGYNQHIDVQG